VVNPTYNRALLLRKLKEAGIAPDPPSDEAPDPPSDEA